MLAGQDKYNCKTSNLDGLEANRGKTLCEGHTVNNLIIILKNTV